MEFPFYKMSGSGNDFIFIDNRKNIMKAVDLNIFIPKVCTRGVSIGADGLVLVEDSDIADFKWQFFNSDASVAEMCGNASRCVAKFAMLNGIVNKSKMSFETLAGVIEAEVKSASSIKVQLTNPIDLKHNYPLKIEGKEYIVSSVNTGVPHAVIKVEDIENFDIKSFGNEVRFHEIFQPAGTNVNVYSKLDDGRLKIRTYERGVENETMACGTGTVAVSIFAVKDGLVESPVTLETQSGIELKVYLEDGKCYLEGEARVVYIGSIQEEAYKY